MQVFEPGPERGEFHILNGRVNALWNNLGDQIRMAYHVDRWPANFVEVNPSDAEAPGIESGDWVRVWSDRVIDQLGDEMTAEVMLLAYATDAVPAGVLYSYFNHPGQPINNLASADTTMQPLNLRYKFKLARGKLEYLGPSEYKTDFLMSFAPRNHVMWRESVLSRVWQRELLRNGGVRVEIPDQVIG